MVELREPREIGCGHCDFKTKLPEAYINHMTETFHGCGPNIAKALEEDVKFRNEFIASIIAIQTCNDPSEIGAEPVREGEDYGENESS